jgi:lysophospholipase L1-like esterase
LKDNGESMKNLRLSLTLNILLVAVGGFFVLKRLYFDYRLAHPTSPFTYADNPQYAEQIRIMAAYRDTSAIVMLGDSHTFKAHWNELLGRGDVANRGISSDITEGYLHRLKYVFACHPRICFVEGGVNDLDRHIPDSAIIEHLRRLIDTLKTEGVTPIVQSVFHVSPAWPESNSFNARITELNLRIEVLARREKINLLDINPQIAPSGILLSRYAQQDGIHLTGDAYLFWAQEVRKEIARYNFR